MMVALYFGFNYQAVVGANQYYRIVTAALSHQSIAHILFNMCAMAVFSVAMEKNYGTFFFFAVNLWLLFFCSAIQLLYAQARIFWLPESLGGASLDVLVTYAYGYSAILFGLVMLLSLTGDRYINFYGCKVCKIFIPFAYLLASQMVAPNADLFGHLSGILAAVILRYCFIYQLRLLPQQSWIQGVEKTYGESSKSLHEKMGYFYASD